MFHGEKIKLAAVQREYLPLYVKWLNDYEVAQFLNPGILAPFNLENETAWFENQSKSKNSFIFAILTLSENKVIGNCGLHDIDFKNRKGVFGIFIGDKNYWSQGYGTDATRTLLRFAFEEINLNLVELLVYDFNPRAMRAYEKAGFRRAGTHRQGLYRGGKFHDEILMSILREEWDQLSK